MALDTAISILTLGDIKQFIEGSTTGSSTYDEQYNQLVNGISAHFNSYCGRVLKATTYSSSGVEPDYDGDGTAHLYLRNFPVSTSTVDVYVDSNWAFTTDTQLDSTSYRINKNNGHIFLQSEVFTKGTMNVRVTYEAGYADAVMPYDLKRAALEACQFFWNREQKKDRIGVRNESFEGGSRSFETDMPWSVQKLLDLYRSPQYG